MTIFVNGIDNTVATTLGQLATAMPEALKVAAQNTVSPIVDKGLVDTVGVTGISVVRTFAPRSMIARPFIGERIPQNVVLGTSYCTLSKWEFSARLDKSDLACGNIGEMLRDAASFGRGMKQHIDDVAALMLVNGTSTTLNAVDGKVSRNTSIASYDGLALFSDSHANCDNLMASTAFTAANLDAACNRMRSFRDESGINLNKTPKFIFHTPDLTSNVYDVLKPRAGDADSDWRTYEGFVSVPMPNYVAQGGTYTDWYLASSDFAFTRYVLRDWEITDQLDGSEISHRLDSYEFGAVADDIIMPGAHYDIIRCTA